MFITNYLCSFCHLLPSRSLLTFSAWVLTLTILNSSCLLLICPVSAWPWFCTMFWIFLPCVNFTCSYILPPAESMTYSSPSWTVFIVNSGQLSDSLRAYPVIIRNIAPAITYYWYSVFKEITILWTSDLVYTWGVNSRVNPNPNPRPCTLINLIGFILWGKGGSINWTFFSVQKNWVLSQAMFFHHQFCHTVTQAQSMLLLNSKLFTHPLHQSGDKYLTSLYNLVWQQTGTSCLQQYCHLFRPRRGVEWRDVSNNRVVRHNFLSQADEYRRPEENKRACSF